MQEKMDMKLRLIRWILRLVLPQESNPNELQPSKFAKMKRYLAGKFRQFIPQEQERDVELLATIEGDTLQRHSDLQIPSGPARPAPNDLREPLTNHQARHEVILMQHLAIDGRQYWTNDSAHVGDSLVMCFPKGGGGSVYGEIKYIVYVDGRHFFAINRVDTLQHDWDFFRPYPNFVASISSSSLGPLDLIELTNTSKLSQYAKLVLNDEFNLIISLSRVSARFWDQLTS